MMGLRNEMSFKYLLGIGGTMHKLATILLVLSVPLMAQWPNHPAHGMPRTADGKPNLSAPAPRTADGKPDLSGVWMVRSPLLYITSDLKQAHVMSSLEFLEPLPRSTRSAHPALPHPSNPSSVTPHPNSKANSYWLTLTEIDESDE
jgi:hypothetical protein